MTLRIKLVYFAEVKELLGKSQDTFDIKCEDEQSEISSQEILDLTAEKYKGVKGVNKALGSCILAVEDEYVSRDSIVSIKDGTEISVIPPISAG